MSEVKAMYALGVLGGLLVNQPEAGTTSQEHSFYNNNYQPDQPHLISLREGAFGWDLGL